MTVTAAEKCDLEVTIGRLRARKGLAVVSLFNKYHDKFPKREYIYQKKKVNLESGNNIILFKSIPCISYSAVVYHDENSNSKFDRNFLGIPKEGYGFSNNPDVKFRPPSYKEAEFEVRIKGEITINLRYHW